MSDDRYAIKETDSPQIAILKARAASATAAWDKHWADKEAAAPDPTRGMGTPARLAYLQTEMQKERDALGITGKLYIQGQPDPRPEPAPPATGRDAAVARREELMNDPAWVQRYMSGDKGAAAEMQAVIRTMVTGA
jgi:hypothetical protein